MEIKYNTPVEVTKNQYNHVVKYFDGICAFRIEDDKYFIKLFLMKFKPQLIQVLETI